MHNTNHVGMLSQESFVTEGNNPLHGNNIPEFAGYKEMMIQI